MDEASPQTQQEPAPQAEPHTEPPKHETEQPEHQAEQPEHQPEHGEQQPEQPDQKDDDQADQQPDQQDPQHQADAEQDSEAKDPNSLGAIRDDLDHHPGGLLPPDPNDQQRLEDAIPRNEDGTPQRFADPFGTWGQLQNDGGHTVPGRSNNCADCSRSFLESWYGNPQVSAARTPDTDANGKPDSWSPESNANENQIRWSGATHSYAGPGNNPATAARIANELQQAGHGSAAIVQVSWPNGGGHAFNAVNHHGKIIWIDTQSGKVSHEPLHIPQAEHVWHIPLGPDRQPLHADDAVNKTGDDGDKKDKGKETGNGADNGADAKADTKNTADEGTSPSDASSGATSHASVPEDSSHPDATAEGTPIGQAPAKSDDTPVSEQPFSSAAAARENTPDSRGTHVSQYLADALRHDQHPMPYGKPPLAAPDSHPASENAHRQNPSPADPQSSQSPDGHQGPPRDTPATDDDHLSTPEAEPAQEHPHDDHTSADDHPAPEEPGSAPAPDDEPSSLAERRSQAEALLGPTAERIVDLDSWLQFHSQKADAEFEQTLNEMREARRLLEENPDHVLHTALELNAPTTESNEALAEFDLGLAEPNGPITRRVEVTTVEKEITKPGDIRNAVAHGFDKINKREAYGVPLPRPRDVSIYLKVKAEVRSKKGLTTERLPDGSVTLRRPDGTLIGERNLFDDILENLGKTPDAEKLDRIICSDPDLGVLAEYMHDGVKWERIR
ncbi:hypothetical protein FNZ23_24170 [Streptomyces benahoarensis]|uniref:Tox-PL domain-containing protein n=1 Tax=Streptomyces benahoarensis TaxID=2595054 RepID=A0A553YVB8_9ACTN|nr:hypothetical protein FNZ23_24170 [Streptomyces benahoarensis]